MDYFHGKFVARHGDEVLKIKEVFFAAGVAAQTKML